MSCSQTHSDAAYVLGALSPAERTTFEGHLVDCADCATAVSRLAPLPGLLGRVDPVLLAPPASDDGGQSAGNGRLKQLFAAVAGQRRRQVRRRRWQLAVASALAALVAAAGGILGFGLLYSPDQSVDRVTVAMAPVGPAGDVVAEVAHWPTAGGTGIWMACEYPGVLYASPAQTFRLVAVGADGSVETVGSWQAGPGEQVELTGLTRLTHELVRLELRSDTDAVLLAHDFD